MRVRRLLALALLPLLPRLARGEELMLAAAASLTDALQEVCRPWQERTGTTVRFDFGATSALARQIREGAPADVFFSADREHMQELEAAGMVAPGARREVLSNVLVIVVPSGSTRAIRKPADLASLSHVALADPESVPAGVYARKYLQSVGMWEAVRERVVPTLDVRAALAAVEGEHADAAIVYRTDAALSRRVRVAFEVPRADGPEIVYTVAPLASAKPAARDLVRYLTSPEARAVYGRYGFVVLGGT